MEDHSERAAIVTKFREKYPDLSKYLKSGPDSTTAPHEPVHAASAANATFNVHTERAHDGMKMVL